MIEEYGLPAVLGNRVLSAREIRDLRLASNVEMYYSARAYALRTKIEYWDSFLEQYPNAAAVLEWAEKEYKEHIDGR